MGYIAISNYHIDYSSTYILVSIPQVRLNEQERAEKLQPLLEAGWTLVQPWAIQLW